MTRNLERFQEAGDLHFITFSCYHRRKFLNHAAARDLFLRVLEEIRRQFALVIIGYVVMPEHVHLLLSEPPHSSLALAIQLLKQNCARELRKRDHIPGEHFWQKRYYDFNVRTEKKRIEKLKYMHRNPVKRELVERPEDWRWSSFRAYLLGESGPVTLNTWPEPRLGAHA